MRLTLLSIIFLLNSVLMFAQTRERVTQGIEWFGTSSAVKLAPKFGVYLDGQYRFAQSMDNMQHQFRVAPEIYVNKNLTISPMGYVQIWNYLYGKQPASAKNNEHRLYQEVKFKHSIGKFFFTHRTRTEERFIQYHSKNTAGDYVDEGFDENFQFRIRHRIWMNMPFKGEKIEPKSFYLASLVELFMSWGDPQYVTYVGKLDQYRLYGALGYQINKSANIQAGPFYQYLVKPKGDKQENNVGVYVQLNYNFDLTKPAAK